MQVLNSLFFFIHLFIVIDLGDKQQAQGKPYALQD